MEDWRDSKIIGIVAGLIFLICITFLIIANSQRTPKFSLEQKAQAKEMLRQMGEVGKTAQGGGLINEK